MIKELDELKKQGKITESGIVKTVMDFYKVDEVDANFIISIERGEIDGDVVELEDIKG